MLICVDSVKDAMAFSLKDLSKAIKDRIFWWSLVHVCVSVKLCVSNHVCCKVTANLGQPQQPAFKERSEDGFLFPFSAVLLVSLPLKY